MPDRRPLFSIPDPQVQQQAQAFADALKLMLDAAFATVLALPGNPAERENDAVSTVCGMASMAGVQFVGRLIERTGIDVDLALSLALADIEHRMRGTLSLLDPAGTA